MDRPDAAVLHGVSRRHRTPSGVVDALSSVDLAVASGTLTVVAGASGSGKSTLLGLVICADRPDEGTVEVAGVDVTGLSRRRRRRVRRTELGVVLATPSDNLLPGLTAAENLRWCAALDHHDGPDVDSLLELFGVGNCAGKLPTQLSGGEQQRVALAAVMAADPTLIVADEPTASLDVANGALVGQALLAAVRAGATVLVATHDPQLIALADHAVFLQYGRVVS